MRLRIHHGACQVGGNCIELECQGKTLLLDLGLPLDSAPKVPNIPGLQSAHPDFLGVVLSHPHLDHYGLLSEVRPEVPVWIGRGAKQLLEAAAPFTTGAALPQTLRPYDGERPFEVGPFRITPYLMDHSAFDAHALLVEAGGKRLFYTGDFRGHGRKTHVFERFLTKAPANIDVLLMEGTTIGRTDLPASEREVENKLVEHMAAHPGMMLACFSGQNIDRFVTFFRASVRASRVFVIDAYMANLLKTLALPSLPDPNSSPHVRVYLPKAQKRKIVQSQRFDLIEPFSKRRIYGEELTATPGRFTMVFRASMIADLFQIDLKSACLIYSLWPGYLDRDRVDLRQWARAAGVAFHIVHSSGHAHLDDLTRMAEAVDARMLLPIHSADPGLYAELFGYVRQVANGAWIKV